MGRLRATSGAGLWFQPLGGALALLLALAGATVLLDRLLLPPPADDPAPGGAPTLVPVAVRDAHALHALFARHEYHWPPQGPVPALAVRRLPAGLDELEVEARKATFFQVLLPLVLAENARIEAKRARLHAAFAAPGGSGEREWLAELARRYRVAGDLSDPAVQAQLLRRVDGLPPALMLAQAANESGWGSSRFAQAGNSLFGLWTYQAAHGLTPARRAEDARHSVRAYKDLYASVRSYYYNLNVGHAYRELRAARARMRAAGGGWDALALAGGLERYSERGAAYVHELRAMMVQNGLLDLGELVLAQ